MALTLKEAFNPRSNSIGFLRWFLATAVLLSHAGPLAGFYGFKNLGTQWSDEQSFGGVAVAGFFFLSGFLITKSRMGKSTVFRFFWRRALRIMPAFWAALIATAFVLAPIAWWHTNHTLHGYFSSSVESPLTYFSNNMWLHMTQHNISGMGGNVPLAECCGRDWNGSAWTLIYEFSGYTLIGVLGIFGVFAYRRLVLAIFLFWLTLNSLTFLSIPVHNAVISPLLNNFFAVMLLTPFMFGMVFALYEGSIRIDDRLAAAAGVVAFYTYFIADGWNVYGQFAFLYLVMWCAIRLPLRNWERFGDLSYGVYIYAWPIMYFASFFHLQTRGWLVYHAGVLIAANVMAFASWHLLEKRALALKNWTPRWLLYAQRRAVPVVGKIRERIVNPEFSSTRFAAAKRSGEDSAPPAVDLVTHDPTSRVEGAHEHGESRRFRRSRRILIPAIGAVALLLFVALAVGLPAVYRHRYEKPSGIAPVANVTDSNGVVVHPHKTPPAATREAFLRNATSAAEMSALPGLDGYYFLGDAYVHNISQMMGLRYYSAQEVVDTAAMINAEREWLARRNIIYEFVVAPAKWDIYSDKLPQWTDGVRLPTILDQLDAYQPHLLVDLRSSLTTGRSVADTYSRLNSHWTPYGAYVAYRELAAQLSQDVPGLNPLQVPAMSGVQVVNEDNEFAGIVNTDEPNNWTVPQFVRPLPSYHLTDSAGTNAEVPGDRTVDMTTMPLVTDSGAANSARLLLLADSTSTSMSPYLAEAFAHTMMVRHQLDTPVAQPNVPALVNSFQPTVVLTMMTERELDFPPAANGQLQMWQSANAYDLAAGAVQSLTVTPTGKAVEFASPTAGSGAYVVQLTTSTTGDGLFTVTVQTQHGLTSTPLIIANGQATTFFSVPAGATSVRLSGPVSAIHSVSATARRSAS